MTASLHARADRDTDAPAIAPRTLNVLMVTPQYFPHTGGVETHIFNVARELAEHNVSVTVLTTDTSGSLPRDERQDKIRILRVAAWPRGSDYFLAPEIYKIIARGAWDIVHCQGCHTLVPPIAMAAALRAGIPFLVTFHTGGHSTSWRNSIRDIQWRTQRPLLARAAKLIAVSRFEGEYFRERLGVPADRVTVIPNGAQIACSARQSDVIPDPSLILSVGRLERYKGHHRLIAALPRIRREIPDARLRIAGTGPYEAELRTMAVELGVEDCVEIGSVPVEDRQGMANVISSAAVVALMSEYEAHPISVMEALALEKPVVVANTSGLKELADDGYATAVAHDADASEIADAMVSALRSPRTPPAFELPSWEACAHRLLREYRNVIKVDECGY